MLTSVNLLSERNGQFANTPLGEQLSSGHSESERSMALLLGMPAFWQAWGGLEKPILTGQPAFDQVHGLPFFEYFGQHPDDAAVFNAAMTGRSDNQLPAILTAYDFSGFTKIVDVGVDTEYSCSVFSNVIHLHKVYCTTSQSY